MRPSNPRSPGLPQRLQHLADLAGTVTALAQRGKCSRKTLQNWLTGTVPVSRAGLIRLAQNLGISEDWLKDGTGDPPTNLGTPDRKASVTVPLIDIADPESVTFPMASVEWLHYAFKLKPAEVIWWHAVDTSMWPEIAMGDPLLLRRIEPVLPVTGTGRLLLVKHQDKLALRVVAFDRDNPEEVILHAWLSTRFPPVRAALKDVEGIGEILWSGRRWDTETIAGPTSTDGARTRRRSTKLRT